MQTFSWLLTHSQNAARVIVEASTVFHQGINFYRTWSVFNSPKIDFSPSCYAKGTKCCEKYLATDLIAGKFKGDALMCGKYGFLNERYSIIGRYWLSI